MWNDSGTGLIRISVQWSSNDRPMIVQWSYNDGSTIVQWSSNNRTMIISDRTVMAQWSYDDRTAILQLTRNDQAVHRSYNNRSMIAQWSCIDCTKKFNDQIENPVKNHVLNGKDWKVGLTKVFMKGACYEKSENSLFFKSRWTTIDRQID